MGPDKSNPSATIAILSTLIYAAINPPSYLSHVLSKLEEDCPNHSLMGLLSYLTIPRLEFPTPISEIILSAYY
jgi:hypothetical protein